MQADYETLDTNLNALSEWGDRTLTVSGDFTAFLRARLESYHTLLMKCAGRMSVQDFAQAIEAAAKAHQTEAVADDTEEAPPMNQPLQIQREVCIFHTYEFYFSRRRGWRLKPEIESQIPIDRNFRAESIALSFVEGSREDIKTFVEQYTLEIASPVPWFDKWPMPFPPTPGAMWSQRLELPIAIAPKTDLTVRLTGKPFKPLQVRFCFAVRVTGVLLYYVPDEVKVTQ